MSTSFDLPFHSLSLLLVGITAALVYTNYSVARHTETTAHRHSGIHAADVVHRPMFTLTESQELRTKSQDGL